MRSDRVLFLLAVLFFCVWPVRAEDLPQQIEKLKDKLPEMKIKETVIAVSPKVRVFLPSGSMDLNLRQEYRKTSFDFSSRYDFVDNFMGFNVDTMYRLRPVALGLDLNDRVDFNEIFAGTQYLQRSQSVSPYAQYPLGIYTYLKGLFRIENTYTSSVASNTTIDRGKNIVGELVLWNDAVYETTTTPKGGSYSLSLLRSFENLGSDYDYAQTDFQFRRFFHAFADHYVEYQFELGYPLSVKSRPLSSYYYAGGYRMLRGYKFKEFRGDALIYSNITYHIPVANINTERILGVPLSIVTWNVFSEAVKIGDRSIFSGVYDTKANIGTGFGYRMMFFGTFPVQMDVSVAKALDYDRLPQFYFTISTVYYTWGNR